MIELVTLSSLTDREANIRNLPVAGSMATIDDPAMAALHVKYTKRPADVSWALSILERFKKKYIAGECHCICECHDTTIVKEGAEVWQNHNSIKIADNDDPWALGLHKYVVFETDTCPVCGGDLPTADGGSESNGMNVV